MPTLIELFKTGYDIGESLPREARARAAARERFGAAADDPGLFAALEAGEMRREQLDLQKQQEGRLQQTQDFQMGVAQQDRQKQAVLGLVNGLRQARDHGQDLGQAFDNLSASLPSLGVDPKDIPEMRQSLIDNPAILDQYYTALTDPAEAAKLQAIQAKAAGAGSEAAAEASESNRVLDDVMARIDLLEDPSRERAGRSVFGLPGPGKLLGSGGLGALGSIPSSGAADYVANLEALKADVRSAAFETLKGGGQITEKESQFAADAIARIDRSTSYDEFRRELKRLRSHLQTIKDRNTAKMGGSPAVPSQGGTSAPSIYPGWVNPKTGYRYKGGPVKDVNSWEKVQ